MVETQRLRLTVMGVSCSLCVSPIRKALEKTEGVKAVGANYVAELVFVDFDPKAINVNRIVSIIKDTGYEAIPRMD